MKSCPILCAATAAICSIGAAASVSAQEIANFGTVTISPAFELNGAGGNVDSIAFWEAPDPSDTLMFVTGKANNVVEVWKYPFEGNELAPIPFANNVNGVVVDQETDLLYVSDRIVSLFSLPGLQARGEFGSGIIGVGENNLDILKHTDGRTLIYVSDDHNVHRFDAESFDYLDSFAPPVTSIETVLADDFYQMILVPEEQGIEGSPGVYTYHPDGTPFERNGSNRFGDDGEFDSDEEGILLYTFPTSGIGDDGTGFYVVSDQRSDQTDFEFFDRVTWSHLGTLRLSGVSNTDGIASTQLALPDYPLGLFTAINDDGTTVGVGWNAIFEAIGFDPVVGTMYETWATSRGLSKGVNAGFEDDPDGDGLSNIREFGTDGDPLSGINDGKMRAEIESIEGTKYFAYTFPVRDGAEFTGAGPVTASIDCILYSLSGSLDLIDFDQPVIELIPARDSELPTLTSGWSYRSFRMSMPASLAPTGFVRLAIEDEMPP